MRVVRPFVLVIVIAVMAGGLAGCNTVRGAGEDLQQGGQAIENAADRVGS